MTTTSLVWCCVKLSMVLAILAISSTSFFRTYRTVDKVRHMQVFRLDLKTLPLLSPYLHKALALQLVHPVGGAVEPLPLGIQN